MVSTNWADLVEDAGEGGDFEVLPVGDYDATVSSVNVKETQTGKTMFEVTYQVTTGPHANRLVWNNMVVSPESPNAMAFFFREMAAMGVDSEFFRQGPTDDQIKNALEGKSATLTLGHREWSGNITNDVKKIKPLVGGAAQAPTTVPQAGVPTMQTTEATSVAPTVPTVPAAPSSAPEPPF